MNKDELKATYFSFYDQMLPEHAEKAKANYDEEWNCLGDVPDNHAEAIHDGFAWHLANETEDYWHDIFKELIEKTYNLQLTPQVCKDKAKAHLYGEDTTNSKMPAHEWFEYLKPEHKRAAMELENDMGVDGELFECLEDALYSKTWSDGQTDINWSSVWQELRDATYYNFTPGEL